MLHAEEAQKRILAAVAPLPAEEVALPDAAGRVAAGERFAPLDHPPFDHATRDGYALRAADTREAAPDRPVRLGVGETIPAGTLPARRVGPGQAARIMTGAPIPPGGDAVVPLEEARSEGDGVWITGEAAPGQHIRRTGETLRRGELLLRAGETLRPTDLALLAVQGIIGVAVHRRPRVALLVTGSELQAPGEPPAPGRIVASNGPLLAALTLQWGGLPLPPAVVPDRREALGAAFTAAAAAADLIVSTGGVSGGDWDLVPPLLGEAGNRLDFRRLAMRPGQGIAFGAFAGVPVVALPGGPFAALAGFLLFAGPAIRRLGGHRHPCRAALKARLAGTLEKPPGLRLLVEARIGSDGRGWRAVPLAKRRGAPAAGLPGLIDLPETTTRVRDGEEVAVLPLDDGPLWTAAP